MLGPDRQTQPIVSTAHEDLHLSRSNPSFYQTEAIISTHWLERMETTLLFVRCKSAIFKATLIGWPGPIYDGAILSLSNLAECGPISDKATFWSIRLINFYWSFCRKSFILIKKTVGNVHCIIWISGKIGSVLTCLSSHSNWIFAAI